MGMMSGPCSMPERICASLAGNCASCSVISVVAQAVPRAGPAIINEIAVNPAMAWFGSTGSPYLGQGKLLSAGLDHRKLVVIKLALRKLRDLNVDIVGKTEGADKSVLVDVAFSRQPIGHNKAEEAVALVTFQSLLGRRAGRQHCCANSPAQNFQGSRLVQSPGQQRVPQCFRVAGVDD